MSTERRAIILQFFIEINGFGQSSIVFLRYNVAVIHPFQIDLNVCIQSKYFVIQEFAAIRRPQEIRSQSVGNDLVVVVAQYGQTVQQCVEGTR